MSQNILAVKNLTKSYGKSEAVKGISFEVKKNEIFALIGPNGAGKSTTLKMVATLLQSTSGSITLNTINVVTDAAHARSLISYLPEEAGAYKNLNGRDYLSLMAELYAKDKNAAIRMLAKGEELSGLEDRLRDKIQTYSKGMTRKLMLARTVMPNPTLAILDEPTSGLDVVNAFEIRKIIKNLAKEGMSVLLSSHNMLEIEFLADRVAIIAGGIIHECGTAVELKTKYKAENLEEVFVKAVQEQ